jgi:hypothetical protein
MPLSNKPLVTDRFTADPSAHVFDGRIYIYPSHDVESGIRPNAVGDHYDMRDYRVYSMDDPLSPVTDHGEVLNLENVPWASRQLWAPDAARKDGAYYLYFPARDKEGIFRIGAAKGESPAGPFIPLGEPIKGTFSIDPAVFEDADGRHYLYSGGLRGGELQKWRNGAYDPLGAEPGPEEKALCPKVARLAEDMVSLEGPPLDAVILDEGGKPLLAGDRERKFFEGPWMHRYRDRYYLSYSTGDSRYIAYAVGDSPWGPFTHRGRILDPVIGWTTHHSIIEFGGRWWLYYHDASLSDGKSHLRCIKVAELRYRADGGIETIDS